MCRLLAVVSPAPRPPRQVLGDVVVDVYRSMSRLHADGWGAAWIEEAGSEGGVPVLRSHRSPSSAADDPAFDERTVSPSRATLFHLRWASTGMDVTGLNAHPFVTDGVAVAHNGLIGPASEVEELLPDDVRDLPRGGTDSERMAALIHHHLRAGADLGEAVALATGALRERFPASSLNMLALSSRTLVVVRASADAVADTDGMRAAGLTDDTAPASHLDGGYFRMGVRRFGDGSIAFSSSGIPRDGFQLLPDETVTAVDLTTLRIDQRPVLPGSAEPATATIPA